MYKFDIVFPGYIEHFQCQMSWGVDGTVRSPMTESYLFSCLGGGEIFGEQVGIQLAWKVWYTPKRSKELAICGGKTRLIDALMSLRQVTIIDLI